MATLNENIATVKQCFSEIKAAVNMRCAEYLGDEDRIQPRSPVEGYAGEIYGAIADIYAKGAEGGSGGDYDEGFEAGKQEVISQSKYIPKSAIGTLISLTDVSEVSHKVKVYGDEQEVGVYGKNLCDYSKFTGNTQADKENVVLDGDTFIFPVGKTYYGLTMTGGIALIKGQTYTFSYEATTAYAYPECQIFYTDDTKIVANNGKTVTIEKDVKSIVFYLSAGREETADAKLSKFQVELGTQATKYELPSRQTITATPNGTEVSSMCPNMTFIADDEIKVDYYSSFGMAEKELAMWKAITLNGTRQSYNYVCANADFSGYTIPDGMCKPKTNIGYMFYAYQGIELPKGVDCSEFDATTTNTSAYLGMFSYATKLKRIYDMGIPALKSYNACYRNCNALETIDIIRVNEETTFDTNSFNSCTSLVHCIFIGILTSNLSMFHCKKLDDETLVSISVALCDLVFSGLGDGWGSRTLTLSAESIARLKELPYPPDDLSPEGVSYAEDGASCYTVIVGRKGWNIA